MIDVINAGSGMNTAKPRQDFTFDPAAQLRFSAVHRVDVEGRAALPMRTAGRACRLEVAKRSGRLWESGDPREGAGGLYLAIKPMSKPRAWWSAAQRSLFAPPGSHEAK